MSITDYKIIWAKSFAELTALVKAEIPGKWSPHGPTQVIEFHDHYDCDCIEGDAILYYQTMVKTGLAE